MPTLWLSFAALCGPLQGGLPVAGRRPRIDEALESETSPRSRTGFGLSAFLNPRRSWCGLEWQSAKVSGRTRRGLIFVSEASLCALDRTPLRLFASVQDDAEIRLFQARRAEPALLVLAAGAYHLFEHDKLIQRPAAMLQNHSRHRDQSRPARALENGATGSFVPFARYSAAKRSSGRRTR